MQGVKVVQKHDKLIKNPANPVEMILLPTKYSGISSFIFFDRKKFITTALWSRGMILA